MGQPNFNQDVAIVDPKTGKATTDFLQKINALFRLLDQVTGDVDGITIPEPATDAEIRGSSGTGYVSAASLASASAIVPLTYAATVAVDWSAGVNFSCVMTGDAVLGTPTNPQPGEWRTVYLGGNDGTSRSLTFSSDYKGDLPTLSDIASTKQYLLSIYCIHAAHFVLKATQAAP